MARAVAVKIREVSHVLVRADREAVLRALPLAPPAASPSDEAPLEVRAEDEAGNESWFIVRAGPDGTRLVHGAAYAPRSLREAVFSREPRAALQRHVAEELEAVKRAAEAAVAPSFRA